MISPVYGCVINYGKYVNCLKHRRYWITINGLFEASLDIITCQIVGQKKTNRTGKNASAGDSITREGELEFDLKSLRLPHDPGGITCMKSYCPLFSIWKNDFQTYFHYFMEFHFIIIIIIITIIIFDETSLIALIGDSRLHVVSREHYSDNMCIFSTSHSIHFSQALWQKAQLLFSYGRIKTFSPFQVSPVKNMIWLQGFHASVNKAQSSRLGITDRFRANFLYFGWNYMQRVFVWTFSTEEF